MAFRYDGDDLGYDLEVVRSTAPSHSDQKTQQGFAEPEARGVVYECQVPPPGTRPGTVDSSNPNRVAVDRDSNVINGSEAWVNIPTELPAGFTRVGTTLLARNTDTPPVTIRFNTQTGQWPTPGGAPPQQGDHPRRPEPAGQRQPPAPRAVDAQNPPLNAPAATTGFDQIGAPQRGNNEYVYYYRSRTDAHVFQKRTVPFRAATAADAPTAAVAVPEAQVPEALRTARPTPAGVGARHGGGGRVAEAAAPRLDPNEERLRGILEHQGLSPKEVDAFMTRIPEGRGRTAAINRYLQPARTEPENSPFRVNTRNAADLRSDILTRARDNAVASARAATGSNQPTPCQVYNNLVANGIIQRGQAPAPAATWADAGVNPSGWVINTDTAQPLANADSLANNPLYASRTATVTSQDVIQDTQRHVLVDTARADYVQYWTQNGGTPEHRPTRSQAEERFNLIAHRLGMTNPDGTVRSGWDPAANTGAAQAFYPISDGQQRFTVHGDGSLATNPDIHLQHEDVAQAADGAHPLPESANPVTRAIRQSVESQLSLGQAFHMLTGENGPGNGPHPPLPEGWSPMDPPLTREEAMAYLQSRGLTDENGNPTNSATPASFRSLAGDVRSGDISRNSALSDVRTWERNEIARTLHNPPFNLSDTQIAQYMLGQHMGEQNVSVADLDAFRRRVQNTRGDAATALRQEVLTDSHNRAPSGDEETTWARDMTEFLNQSRRGREDSTAEARRGRVQGSREGDLNRTSQERNANTAAGAQRDAARTSADGQRDSARISADGGRDQARISAASQERMKDREIRAQAEQGRLQREHDAVQREKDRENQLIMSVLQMMGSMISGAMQAMSGVGTAAIQSSLGAAYQNSRAGQQPNIS